MTDFRPDPETLDGLRLAMLASGIGEMELEFGDIRLRMVAAPLSDIPSGTSSAPPMPLPKPEPTASTLAASGPGILRLADPAGGPVLAPVGAKIVEGQIVALLQAGAALWPVTATGPARISAILAEEGAVVGYGTPIFLLDR